MYTSVHRTTVLFNKVHLRVELSGGRVGETGGDVGWFLYQTILPVYTVITAIEYLFLAFLTTLTGLLSAWIVYKVIKPGLKRTITGYIPVIGKMVKKQLDDLVPEGLENIDLESIAGKLGGGEGGSGGLGDLAGLLGGGGGGLGDILKLLSSLGGKNKEGGGSSGW